MSDGDVGGDGDVADVGDGDMAAMIHNNINLA